MALVFSFDKMLSMEESLVASREDKQWQHHKANKQMRLVRKQIKRNRSPKPARRRDWVPDSLDDPDAVSELSLPASERVMPRGERERRQSVMQEALARLEGKETADAASHQEGPSTQRGTVIEVSTSLCRVQSRDQVLVCHLRGSLSAEDTGFTNIVAVGDRVLISQDGHDSGVVEQVLPRKSVLVRPDVFHSHLQQVIVANADQLLVVASWRDPAFWPELVDRYLITAERNNLTPILCVNKVDLAEDMADCQAAVQPYLQLGYQVLLTSAVEGHGIERVRGVLAGKTTVLAGMSGVGKSSLLAVVQPGLHLRISEISERRHEGRHTTSQVNLIALQIGGFVVDTPGIREFGLGGLQRAELVRFYPDIQAAAARCRFANCSHTHEPGCAVRAAVSEGTISDVRHHSYQAIYSSLPS